MATASPSQEFQCLDKEFGLWARVTVVKEDERKFIFKWTDFDDELYPDFQVEKCKCTCIIKACVHMYVGLA